MKSQINLQSDIVKKKRSLRRLFRDSWQIQNQQINMPAIEKNLHSLLKKVFGRHRFLNRSHPTGRIKVLAYWPMPEELNIPAILAQIPNVEIWLPEIKNGKLMCFKLGGNLLQKIHAKNIDFIIVPGLFADCFGTRLGRGRGYYDKTLRFFPFKRTAFVGANWQIVPNQFIHEPRLPRENFDHRVKYIVGEKRIILSNCQL